MAIKLFVYGLSSKMSLAVWTHKHTGMHEFVSEVTLYPYIQSHTLSRQTVHNALRNV